MKLKKSCSNCNRSFKNQELGGWYSLTCEVDYTTHEIGDEKNTCDDWEPKERKNNK